MQTTQPVRIDNDFLKALQVAQLEMQKLYGEDLSLSRATKLMARSRVIIVIPSPGANGQKWGRPVKKITLATF